MNTLSDLLPKLEGITISTPWREAHSVILDSEAYQNDPELKKIETIDILTVYDDYTRQLEKEHDESSKKYRVDMVRRGRKAREGFKALLSELADSGKLRRESLWKDLYGSIKNDERYLNLLGISGSSPLDLFMDVVDDLGVEVEGAKAKIDKCLKELEKEIKVETTFEEYEAWCKEAKVESSVDEKMRREVFEMVSPVVSII
jgi:pre-mRNA-processing factor 40